MKKIITTTLVAIFTIALLSKCQSPQTQDDGFKVYEVAKTKKPIKIDSDWDKKQWKRVKPIEVTHFLRDRDIPAFIPRTQVKMVYDKDNLYVIFKVEDKYVRCITDRINGPVFRDSAVEFFFSPDVENPLNYFNLETNCGGTPLMQFHRNLDTGRESNRLAEEDIMMVEIVSSLPKIIDPEITDNVTWTIEYRLPLALMKKYSTVTTPAKGVEWRGNFYKIASITSNPHYITWSKVDHRPNPNFHSPEVFGRLIFK